MPPISLNCLIHGDEPAFAQVFDIEAAPTEVITDFREKIWAKKYKSRVSMDPDELALYRLKTPVSTSSNATFNDAIAKLNFDTDEGQTLIEELNPTATLEQSGLSEPAMMHLHILVVAPTEVAIPKGFGSLETQLLQLFVKTVLMVPDASSLGTERGDNHPFKLDLYKFYFEPDAFEYPATLTCSLTGVTLSSKAVVATHLWKYPRDITGHWFGFDDIDNPRNGLLLYKPIEEAYDRHLLCFYQDDNNNPRCRVLSKSLRTMTFSTFFANNRERRPSKATGIEPSEVLKSVPILEQAGFSTFGDLERADVYLHFPPMREPFKRVLNLHAIKAYKLAVERGDASLSEFSPFKDFESNGGVDVIEAWRKGVATSLGED